MGSINVVCAEARHVFRGGSICMRRLVGGRGCACGGWVTLQLVWVVSVQRRLQHRYGQVSVHSYFRSQDGQPKSLGDRTIKPCFAIAVIILGNICGVCVEARRMLRGGGICR